MALDAKKHASLIQSVTADIQAGVFDNLKALENRVADLVATGQLPENLRPQIEQAYAEYSQAIAGETSALSEISADVNAGTDMPDTGEDAQAERVLLNQSSRTVREVVGAGVEDMMTTLVLAGAAGATTQALVNAARGRVSGIFMESDDRLVRRTQSQLRRLQAAGAEPEEIRKAVRVIRERLTGINVTASLRDLTSKTVQDTVMKFDGAYTAGKAKRAGVKRWRYDGGSTAESRDWCLAHVGNTYTEEEIYNLWTDDWSGKEPGDPFVVRGGYNCQHFWVPVEDE